MFLIFVIELVLVSMVQASENCLDIYTVGHIREHDFVIIGDGYWNTWECSNIEKKCCTAVGMLCQLADEISNGTINYCQKRQEGCSPVLNLPTDAALHRIHMMDEFQRLGSSPNEQIGCKYMTNLDGIRKFKFQPRSSFRNNTYHCHKHFVYLPNTFPEQQQINQNEEVNTEVIRPKYHGQLLELTLTEGGVLCTCVIICGFLVYCIIKLHIHYGTSFCSIQKKFLSPNDTVKEITITCQLSEGSGKENTDIESCINCLLCPKQQASRRCRVQPFLCNEKEVSEMDYLLKDRALHGTVDVTAQTSINTDSEVKSFSIKQKTLEVTFQTFDDTSVEDLQVKKGFFEVTAQTSLLTEVENLAGKEGTVKSNAKAANSTEEEDFRRKASNKVSTKANKQAEVCELWSVGESLKNTLKASFQDVKSCKADCHLIIQVKELENSDDSITSHELVKEDCFGDYRKIKVLNQSFCQTTCKFEGDKSEDRRNDISDYQDIHKRKNQLDEFGEILESIVKHKKHSYGSKGSDARDRTVTSTASQEWLKKNPDSDISLSLRDLSLSEEKDNIALCFQEHSKCPESQPSASGMQQEFTPVTSTEESPLLVTEEPYDASSQKCKEIFYKNSDNCLIRPSDFISIESEKKKKSLCSKLHLRTTKNSSCVVSHKNKLKYAEDLKNVNEVNLSPSEKQETSLSMRAFFAAEDASCDQKKDANETKQKFLSDVDVMVQKKKYEVEIDDRTVRDIDLQEKQKYNLRQIVWFSRNWLPQPQLGRDAIVGFVEEQTRDGNGGSILPSSENEELREMLRQLASDNVPGPQITMKYEMLRLCTMKTFPGQNRPFAIKIIGAGFYYAGHQDQVICYCCGIRKDSWVIGDIPLLIHQKKAPNCDFLTHNALVNFPIRKVIFTESSSLAEVRLLAIQRSDGSNLSDMANGESSLMLPSSEQNQVSISNTPHQMLVTNKSSPPNQLIASGRQNVLDNVQTVSADSCFMEEPPPKYPQYAVKNARINSFQGWPAELQQRPEEMAECGFYYAGFSDCVRCFNCGVGLRHWMNEDDPWIEHARWSTECIYVRKMKGEEFVSLVKMAVEIAEGEEAIRNNGGGNQALQNSNETAPAVPAKECNKGITPKNSMISKLEDAQGFRPSYFGAPNKSGIANSTAAKDLPGNMGATAGSVVKGAKSTLPPGNSEIQKYLLTDAAQSVLDTGYQPKLVLRAIERVLMKKGKEDLTGQIIMEAVFEIEEEDMSQNKTEPASLQSAEGGTSNRRAYVNNDASNKKDEQQGHEASINTQSEESQIDPEKIMREHRELCEATLCKICLENTISVVFLPCGHLVTCSDCAPAMRKCPICRTLIKGTVKTFYG